MFVSHKLILFLSGVIALLSLSACNGIFKDIYDEPLTDENGGFGFVEVDENAGTGRIYIDATDYTEWHYIDLHNKKVVTEKVGQTAPAAWDVAVHRYDAKTNGGAVTEVEAKDFNSLPHINTIPDESFVYDEWTTDRITIDMSQMMDGVIVYAEDYYNPCLSKWLNVNTSVMPPIYTLSSRIYLIRLPDSSYAALRLSNYMNGATVKGFMTIEYQ